MSEYDAWAPVYDAWAADMTEDVAHYVSLAREADGPIVELMVGSGRVAIEVVRQTGKPVLGIDSSPAMLEIARERSAGLPLELRLGDVRDLQLDEPAALIYVPFRSLLHLHGWQEKRQVFERVAASLRPGASPSTPSSSATRSRRGSTGRHRTSTALCTRCATYPPTTASTLSGTTPRRSSSGGPPSPNGTGCSTSPGSRSRPCTAGSTAVRSTRSRSRSSTSPAGPERLRPHR